MTDDLANNTGMTPVDDDTAADADALFGVGADDADDQAADQPAPASADQPASTAATPAATADNSLQAHLQRQMNHANTASYQYIFAKHQLIYLKRAYAEYDNSQHKPFINTMWIKSLQGKDNTLPGMPITNRPFSNGFALQYDKLDHFQRMSIGEFNQVLALCNLGQLTPEFVEQYAHDDARSQVPLYNFDCPEDRTNRLIAVYADIIPDRSIVGDPQHKLNNYGAGWVSMHDMHHATPDDFNAELELHKQKEIQATLLGNEKGKSKQASYGKEQPQLSSKSDELQC